MFFSSFASCLKKRFWLKRIIATATVILESAILKTGLKKIKLDPSRNQEG
jgi:hypothetical protein